MLHTLKRLVGNRNPLRLAYHRTRGLLAAMRFGFPARNLTVIGVTGTDGKTTTVGMIAHIANAAGIRCGALSTAFFQVNEAITWNETQKTSPSPFVIQRFLRDLRKQGCTHAVVECSSHGLVQGRLACIWPRIALMTNTSPEHLDYHGTMEQYRKDKSILFTMLHGRGTKILNRSDGSYSLLSAIPSKETRTFSLTPEHRRDERHLWLSDLRIEPHQSSAVLHDSTSKEAHPLLLRLPGSFNLENALAAIAAANAAGVDTATSVRALRDFRGAPGRMERIEAGQPFTVFVDFTVTPGAYEKTLEAARALCPRGSRVLVLTGSCGDRMREKRPEVGRICSARADVVVVSNEDPYTEDPERIINEVWDGVDRQHCEAHRIPDRREAIAWLLKAAHPGDVVLLCGKGADTTMMTAQGQVPWNEREIVRAMLQEMFPHA